MAKQRSKAWVLPVALLIIGIILAVPKLLDMANGKEGGGGRRGGGATAVRVVTLEPREIQDTLMLNGTLAGSESITLQSEIVGRVTRVLFREGSRVSEGQVLLELDDSELRAEKAALRTQLELAEETYARRQRLRQNGLVSEENYDEARNNRNVLQTRIELIDARLAKTVIKAPFSGIIGLRQVSPGELIDRDTPIANLVIVEQLKLTFGLPEVYQARLRENLSVTLQVAGVEEIFQGQVYAWDPRIDEESRTIRVRARVDNPQRRLLPGNFAIVELALESIPDALMIPSTALVRGLEQNSVFVVEEGAARERSVEVGLRTRDQVQITAGLAPGEQVIYLGVQSLRDGASVTVSDGVPVATTSAQRG